MLVLAAIVIFFGLILIFCFDLPGGDDVGGGPMTKYKLIMTHFQVRSRERLPHHGSPGNMHTGGWLTLPVPAADVATAGL